MMCEVRCTQSSKSKSSAVGDLCNRFSDLPVNQDAERADLLQTLCCTVIDAVLSCSVALERTCLYMLRTVACQYMFDPYLFYIHDVETSDWRLFCWVGFPKAKFLRKPPRSLGLVWFLCNGICIIDDDDDDNDVHICDNTRPIG